MTKNNLKVVKSAKDKDLENKEKNKALDAAISQITDTFGKGSVMKLGQQKAMDVESISTGSLSIPIIHSHMMQGKSLSWLSCSFSYAQFIAIAIYPRK